MRAHARCAWPMARTRSTATRSAGWSSHGTEEHGVPAQALLARPFGHLSELIRLHARENPAGAALAQDGVRISYAELDRRMDGIACGLQRRGIGPGERIAL